MKWEIKTLHISQSNTKMAQYLTFELCPKCYMSGLSGGLEFCSNYVTVTLWSNLYNECGLEIFYSSNFQSTLLW